MNSHANVTPLARERHLNMTDHADAARTLLLDIAKRLANGEAPEDLGPQVILIGRMMARAI